MSGRKKRYVTVNAVDFINLTDDEDELQDILSIANSREAEAQAEYHSRRTEREMINSKLKRVRGDNPALQITDHAVVRYLERVVGMDVETIRKEMLGRVPESHIPSPAPGFIKIDVENLQYVIRDNIIISVVPIAPKEKNETINA